MSGASGEILLGLVNSADGQDAEFNDWYTNVHIPEILQLPGFVSAQRYANSADEAEVAATYRYATVYQIDGSALEARAQVFGATLTQSTSLDPTRVILAAFTALGEPISG